MKKSRRILSLMLALALVLSLLPSMTLLRVSAANMGDKTSSVIGTLDSTKSISLPFTVHNYPNDGMLFEYASYNGGNTTYARLWPQTVTSAYGEAWYANGVSKTTRTYISNSTTTTESFTVIGTYYIAIWTSVEQNDAKDPKDNPKNPDGTSPYYYVTAASNDKDVELHSEFDESVEEGRRQWLILMDANGYYLFFNIANGKCMDLENGNARGEVICWQANWGAAQRWLPTVDDDGAYRFTPQAQSGQRLDLHDGYHTNGCNVHCYDYIAGGLTQKWSLIPVSGTVSSKSAEAGQAMMITSTSLDASQDSALGGSFATIVEQTMEKAAARYVTLVYNVESADLAVDTIEQPFKLVPSYSNTLAADVNGGDASDGQTIQLWTSNANDTSTTKYLKAEPAGDGSYYLRWYRCDANGNFTASNYYIGGISDISNNAVCRTKSNANRFYIIANDDGTYSFQFAGVTASVSGEKLYLDCASGGTADGTKIQSWRKNEGNPQRFYLKNFAQETITFPTQTYTLYPGFDGESTENTTALKENVIEMELSTAPGYHTITLDLSTAAGYAAAQKLSSLTVGTAYSTRGTISIAAVGGFESEQEAKNFGLGVRCALTGSLYVDSFAAESQWRETTEADYNANKDREDCYIRRYYMGNNLAYGMLLPNSGAGGGSYYLFDNFGYALGNGETTDANLAASIWKAYEVYHTSYMVESSSSRNGRWFVNTQGETGYSVKTPYTTTIDGTTYADVSKYLPNMHSYINGMATVGLIEYTIDPETKQPVYTQETVQRLAELLKMSLAISEVNDASTYTYNYNFVQGEKIFGDKDWAQSIRDYLSDKTGRDTTSTTDWAGYVENHTPLLEMSWTELTDAAPNNFCNYLDVAFWMLNSLYRSGNGISTEVEEYDHLTLTLETNSAGQSYYVFDGGYEGVIYDANTKGISLTGAEKTMVYYSTTAQTTANPFLPTTGSTSYNATVSPYFADDGVSSVYADDYDTYVGRDFNFTMEGHGQFIFHTDKDLYFNFEGDDDVYLFINNKLVLDIGAAHSITKSRFNLNDYIEECGLVDGETYDFDLYYMERHGYGSNIRIETNIEITSTDVVTEKGAQQNGTEVDDYGLVSKDEVLEYHFTLRNDGYALPLTNLAFYDELLDFNAGYNGVTLGTYEQDGKTIARSIKDLYAVLELKDGTKLTVRFDSESALKQFLTNVKCEGHESAGLSVGESLTLYGIKYRLKSEGLFKNTVYSEANSIHGKANFAAYAGEVQHYYMWAGHPIAVSAADASGTALGSNASNILAFSPSAATHAVYSYHSIPDGVYSIGAAKNRGYTWATSDDGSAITLKNAQTLYSDGTAENEPLFYIRYDGHGYYTIQSLQSGKFICIDIASGTDGSSKNDTADYDDRLVLREMTLEEALASDTALWRIDSNDGNSIAASCNADSFVIRPKLNLTYAVDLDSGTIADNTTIHLWTKDSSNVGWYFNGNANGYSAANSFGDAILIFDYATAGTYTAYYSAKYADGADTVSTLVPVVIHVMDVANNTYVLDYGLPVDLSDAEDGGLLNNDTTTAFGTTTNAKVESLITDAAYLGLRQLAIDGKLTEKTNAISGTATNSVENGYGTFQTESGKLVFTPTEIMNGASEATVAVRVYEEGQTPSDGIGKVDVHKEVEMYEGIITVPASVVYYEDNFGGINYEENDGIVNVGGGDGDYQDADQSGQYGQDSSYENEGYEESGGSVTMITVTADEKILSFSFRGTGFEIISRCSANCSATVVATVYNEAGEQVKNIPVITEYDNGGDDYGNEVVYQAPIISVNDLAPAKYNVKLSVVARQNYDHYSMSYGGYTDGVITYKIVEKSTGTVYYKYYNVAEGTSTYKTEDGTPCENPMMVPSYLYIDGVRIFNPLAVSKEDGINNDPDGYYTDTESGAVIYQIHDLIVEEGKAAVGMVNSETVTVFTQHSSYVENRNNNLITGNESDSVDAYALLGPNNELYLDGLSLKQAIAFYAKPVDGVALTERTLQIGVRGIDKDAIEGFTTVELIDDPSNDTKLLQSNMETLGEPAWTKVATVKSGTEQYYVLDPTLCQYDEVKGAYLVVLAPQDGMVSLTGLKVKGYEILPIAEKSQIVYNDDGSLTEESIAVVNAMLAAFSSSLDSDTVVVPRAQLSTDIEITVSAPDEPAAPVEPTEPTPDTSEKEVFYQDIAGTWYAQAVSELHARGLIYGYEDGLFHGEKLMSRERFIVLLVRTLGLDADDDDDLACRFVDVVGRWSEKEVEIAARYGLVAGVSETEFAPTRSLTRQEMMVIVARAIEIAGIEKPTPASLDRYTDADTVASWAVDSVKLLVASGMISGVSATELAPTRECTRSEMCMVVYRLLCAYESK